MKKLFTIFAGLLITVSVCGQTGEIIAVPLGQPRPTITDKKIIKGDQQDYKSPLFTWTPIIPTPKEGYTLKVVEIIGKQTPDEAMKNNVPVLKQDGIKETSFQFPVGTMKWANGKSYVYMVSDGNQEQSDFAIVKCCEPVLSPQDAKPGTVMITLGAGSSMPNNDSKDNSHLSNSPVFTADAYIPLVPLGNETHFGINVGGSYHFGSSVNNPSDPLPSAFNIVGQSSPPSVSYSLDSPGSKGFSFGAGPQFNFHLGKNFIVSPILSLEYLSITRKEIRTVQTSVVDGETFYFNLTTLPETKTSGFGFTPKIRLNYMFTQSIGAWIESSYTFGPKTQTSSNVLIPDGDPDEEGNYNLAQIQNATYMQKETVSASYKALGVNVGIVYAFKTVYPNPHRYQK